jgi:hypothetical protein
MSLRRLQALRLQLPQQHLQVRAARSANVEAKLDSYQPAVKFFLGSALPCAAEHAASKRCVCALVSLLHKQLSALKAKFYILTSPVYVSNTL